METDSKQDAGFLRIGDLARVCDKTHRALHLYEEMGLLAPAYRTKGGFRLYDPSAIKRVRWISCLQEAEWSLPQIRQFLEVLENQSIGRDSMAHVRAMLQEKISAIQAQRQRLEQLEKELEDGLRYVESCQECRLDHPIQGCKHCALHGHQDTKPLLIAGIHHGAS